MSEIKATTNDDIAYLATLSYISAAIRILIGLPRRIIYAYYLGVVGFGLIKIVELIIKYSGYSSLGSNVFLSREISVKMGQGKTEKIDLINSNILFWSLFSSSICVITILIIYKMDSFSLSQNFSIITISLLCLYVFSSRLVTFLRSLSKGYGRFDLIGKLELISTILSPIIIVPLVIFYGFLGFILGTAALSLIQSFYYIIKLYKSDILPPSSSPSILEFKSYLPLSLQLWLITFLSSFTFLLTPTLVSIFFSIQDLGILAFAVSSFALASSLTDPIGKGLSRKILFESGSKNSQDSKEYLFQPLILFLLSITLAYGTVFFLFEFLIINFISDFVISVQLMKVILFANIFYFSTLIPSIILNSLNRQKERALLFGLSIILNLLISTIFIVEGYDLIYMVYSMTLSFFILSMLFFYFAFREYSHIFFYNFAFKFILTIILVYISLQLIHSFDYQIKDLVITNFAPIYTSLFWTILNIFLFNISIIVVYQLIFPRERPLKSLFLSFKIFKQNALKSNQN